MFDYVITDGNNRFIKLDAKGTPVVCNYASKDCFDYHKAKNILQSLPKTLKHIPFEVKPLTHFANKKGTNNQENKKEPDNNAGSNMKILASSRMEIQYSVKQWIERFGSCGEVLQEAEKRKAELNDELIEVDQECSDILHIIEIEDMKDLYGGWVLYKKVKELRQKRRTIKDEMIVIDHVLEKIDTKIFQRENIESVINKLANRKYYCRVVKNEKQPTQ